MKILFVTGECLPFIKTGGLADVIGAVPKILAKKGYDVRIIIPGYSKINREKFNFNICKKFTVNHKGNDIPTIIKESDYVQGVKSYIVEQNGFFNREKIYGEDDDAHRFIFFQKSVLALMDQIGFYPDVVHCHDWHTGLVPVYIKEAVKYGKVELKNTKSVFTIHNLGYQGIFSSDILQDAGLGFDLFTSDKLEFYGKINFMKAGLVYADKITTVSPTYAKEILRPENSWSLDGILNARVNDVIGIINGIDYNEWGPDHDLNIPCRYSYYKREGKQKCKEIIQKYSGLPVKADAPLFTLVSRLATQKGFDILIPAIRDLLYHTDAQFIFQGTGEKEYEQLAYDLSNDFKNQVCFYDKYSEAMARAIYSAGDIFLMPSKYEPCGLGQMIALAYGNVPLVSYTGGLCDTIIDYDINEKGNGFIFSPITVENFRENLWRVYRKYKYEKEDWEKIVNNAFKSRYTWNESVDKYEELYKKIIGEQTCLPK